MDETSTGLAPDADGLRAEYVAPAVIDIETADDREFAVLPGSNASQID